MSEKVKFEIQVETPSTGHGWRAIGGREGRVYFNEDNFVETKVNTIEEARRAIKQIHADWKKHYCKQRELRIVKITIVTTYEIVE